MSGIILLIVAALVAANITARMVTWARRRALVDVPNDRSSHTRPTPTGAGVAILFVTATGMLLTQFGLAPRPDVTVLTLLAIGCGVAAVSWIDDRRGLSPVVRLIVHGTAGGALIGALGPTGDVPLPTLGTIVPGVVASVLAVWWIVGLSNAYNFMDGVDGIAAGQGIAAGLTWGVAGTIAGEPAIAMLGWVIAGGCLGFLRHNWEPARIFMGDVGAVFLGFLFAGLTVVGTGRHPGLAIVGLSTVWPFVFDTAFTLVRRAVRRENLLKAHRSHLYQRLVIAGWSHGRVTAFYFALSVATSLAGLATMFGIPGEGVILAVVLTGIPLFLWSITITEERRQPSDGAPGTPAGAGSFSFTRNRYILAADVVLVAFAACAGFLLRFDALFVYTRDEFPLFLVVVLFVKPLVFLAFGLYKRYWRYASVLDLVAVVLAVSAAEIIVATIVLGTVVVQVQLFGADFEFSRSVLAIDWLVTLTCAGGVRMSVRVFSESSAGLRSVRRTAASSAAPKRVLIVGAGDAGVNVLREARRNPSLGIHVVGFLDDDPAKVGKRIQATTVLGPLSSLATVAGAHEIDEAVIALPSAPGTVVRRVIESCAEAGITSTAVPGMFELLDGNVSVSRLRRVEIGDLLRRTQVSGSPESARYLSGQTVLVTGAGGSIGSELCYQIAHTRPSRLVLLGHGENSLFAVQHDLRERAPWLAVDTIVADIRDAERLRYVFLSSRPHAVFHAAAHKHVPLMELNAEEAVTNNVFGTHHVVNAAIDADVERLVLISTDKAVAPSSVMGATKRIAETIVRDAAGRHGRAFVVVRFGNVLDSRGSVVPIFKQQIARGGPVCVTHPDMKRFFMTIPEAVHLVLQAGGLGRGGELFVLNMGEPVRIVDLAQDLIRLSGYEAEAIRIEFTGLRPGEKIEERLWEEGATVSETTNPDVLCVTEREIAQQPVGEMLGLLKSAVDAHDRVALAFALSTCLSSFVPADALGADNLT
jgi:FlaA1/EpsC-like NDP-sugar epimerase/UDP-N-acetylmuramyl pentapeptide phosphotransferase/UDP-N-acetylglucosamine-1-phosphate transferase